MQIQTLRSSPTLTTVKLHWLTKYKASIFRDNEETGELILDNNDLERERGITIVSKNVSVSIKM